MLERGGSVVPAKDARARAVEAVSKIIRTCDLLPSWAMEDAEMIVRQIEFAGVEFCEPSPPETMPIPVIRESLVKVDRS
jgi:hypothetical protein